MEFDARKHLSLGEGGSRTAVIISALDAIYLSTAVCHILRLVGLPPNSADFAQAQVLWGVGGRGGVAFIIFNAGNDAGCVLNIEKARKVSLLNQDRVSTCVLV